MADKATETKAPKGAPIEKAIAPSEKTPAQPRVPEVQAKPEQVAKTISAPAPKAPAETATAAKTVAKAQVAPKKPVVKKAARKAAKKTVAAKKPAAAGLRARATEPTKSEPNRTSKMAEATNPTENMKAQTETAMNQSKVAVEEMTAKSRDAMERGVKAMEEVGGFARGNVEALVEASKVYVEGTQSIVRDQAEFAKKSVEDLSANMQKISSVKNPNEVMQVQSEFMRGQFDQMVSQTSTMTERMFRLAGEVMAPLQNRMAVAGEKFKSVN
ncbi:phasin family protein [Pacificimonas sp. ICDLI1SI03]